MLRITENERDGRTWLVLEGKLIGPWVAELQSVCDRRKAGGRLAIDLSQVTFVDPAGVTLLRRLTAEGVHVLPGSSFIRELLRVQAP